MDEATFDETPYGKNPASEGWFVLNLDDALAVRRAKGGAIYPLEPQGGPLSGECTLIVEEQERPLRQWDLFHCPAGTRHIFVGAGDGPCAILMIGARSAEPVLYPVSEVAAKYGASVATETPNPDEAYADWPPEFDLVRLPWPVE
jgi:hypothetical protein